MYWGGLLSCKSLKTPKYKEKYKLICGIFGEYYFFFVIYTTLIEMIICTVHRVKLVHF